MALGCPRPHPIQSLSHVHGDIAIDPGHQVEFLLRLAGVPIPPQVQGDQLPVPADCTTCEGDSLALCEHHGWRSLRLPGFRYVAEASGVERLYDLDTDPWEYRDVAADPTYAGALADARKALLGRMLRIEQPLTREWPY